MRSCCVRQKIDADRICWGLNRTENSKQGPVSVVCVEEETYEQWVRTIDKKLASVESIKGSKHTGKKEMTKLFMVWTEETVTNRGSN